MAANTIDSTCKIYHKSDIVPKLLGVTFVNMVLSIMKDRAFAVYFQENKIQKKVGLTSIAVWFVRDVLTIGSSFLLPQRIARKLEQRGYKYETAIKVSQMVTPMAFQIFLTPIHLLGYNLYYKDNLSMSQRVKDIAKIYPGTVLIRMIRMGAAYGVGGIGNRKLRNSFIGKYEGKNWDSDY